jgi:hypothetical protein
MLDIPAHPQEQPLSLFQLHRAAKNQYRIMQFCNFFCLNLRHVSFIWKAFSFEPDTCDFAFIIALLKCHAENWNKYMFVELPILVQMFVSVLFVELPILVQFVHATLKCHNEN